MAAPARLPEVGDAASVQMSIDAIEFQLSLVDSDVRKVLSALHGTSKATYAGSSSATPEGKAFLEQELDGLMAAKARYKEIKLARMQLQRDLPAQAVIDSEIARVDAEVREVLVAIQGSPAQESTYSGESKDALEEELGGLMSEKAKYKEKKLSAVQKDLEEKVAVHQPPPNLAGTHDDRTTILSLQRPCPCRESRSCCMYYVGVSVRQEQTAGTTAPELRCGTVPAACFVGADSVRLASSMLGKTSVSSLLQQ